MKGKYVIDRFEGEMAVIELDIGKSAVIERAFLPKDAKEGDTLEINIAKTDEEDDINIDDYFK